MSQSPPLSQQVSEFFDKYLKPRVHARQQDPSILEEQTRIVEKASGYDQLEPSKGWGDVLEFILTIVNREITEATENPMNPEHQRLHVIRWNAMRELVDATISEIKDTRRERDRIMEQRREDERNS